MIEFRRKIERRTEGNKEQREMKEFREKIEKRTEENKEQIGKKSENEITSI